MLRDSGYQTWHVGKWHLGGGDSGPLGRGFDDCFSGVNVGGPVRYFAPGLDDDTVVAFTSDNGGVSSAWHFVPPGCNSPLSEGKGWTSEGGIRVPMAIRWPGQIPAGSSSDVPVIGMDLVPTFLRAAGLEPDTDAHPDGLDLLPLVRAEPIDAGSGRCSGLVVSGAPALGAAHRPRGPTGLMGCCDFAGSSSADVFDVSIAIWALAALTAASGIVVLVCMSATNPRHERRPSP